MEAFIDNIGLGKSSDDRFVEEKWLLRYGDEEPPPAPDSLDLVMESSVLIATFTAEQFRRIEYMRQEMLADTADDLDRAGRDVVAELVERSLRLELAAALRITEHAADRKIRLAEALVRRYPTTLTKLSSADLTERHAEILVDALEALDPAVRDRVYDRALDLGTALPCGQFRRALQDLIEAEHSHALAARQEEALHDRRVSIDILDNGMGWLNIYGPAVEITAVHHRLTAMARALAGRDEDRTIDQKRSDITFDLLLDGETASLSADARGIRPQVTVTVPVLTLLGAAHTGPATVEGVGPVPVDLARDLVGTAGSGWMRVLTHPETGVVLSVGRDLYRPPSDLRRLVAWRAATCMAPGCRIPASRCEVDHTLAWEHGGTTSADNLAPLCKGHHILKHNSNWTVTHTERGDGSLQWTSPAGRRYLVPPRRHTPTFTALPAPPPTPPTPQGTGDPPPF